MIEFGPSHTCQHSHPYLTNLRLGALFLNCLKCIRTTIVGHDDTCVFHVYYLVTSGDSATTTPFGPRVLAREGRDCRVRFNESTECDEDHLCMVR